MKTFTKPIFSTNKKYGATLVLLQFSQMTVLPEPVIQTKEVLKKENKITVNLVLFLSSEKLDGVLTFIAYDETFSVQKLSQYTDGIKKK